MYHLRTTETKTDPEKRWNLPERVFFACGACHILAYAFSQRYADGGFVPIWIKPSPGYKGNHIVMIQGDCVFDYHGYSQWPMYFDRYRRKARMRYPNWDGTLQELPIDVLVSEEKSREYEGLWLREPGQFLHNALPRSYRYLSRFKAPDSLAR